MLSDLHDRRFDQGSECFDYQNPEIADFMLAQSLTFIALLPIAKLAIMEK